MGGDSGTVHSVWFYALSVLCGGLEALVNTFAPAAPGGAAFTVWTALPSPVLGPALTILGVLGLFIDIPVLFGCLAFLMLWRAGWLVVNVVRVVVEFIPFM